MGEDLYHLRAGEGVGGGGDFVAVGGHGWVGEVDQVVVEGETDVTGWVGGRGGVIRVRSEWGGEVGKGSG